MQVNFKATNPRCNNLNARGSGQSDGSIHVFVIIISTLTNPRTHQICNKTFLYLNSIQMNRNTLNNVLLQTEKSWNVLYEKTETVLISTSRQQV